MIESLLLIIFFIVGGLFLLLAVFFFAISAIRKSKTMFKLGIGVLIVPACLYGLTYWYYDIYIANSNKETEKEFVGKYFLISDDDSTYSPTYLKLYEDNTFELGRNNFSTFYGKGVWKAGATDNGQFEFKESKNDNSVIFWATPAKQNNNCMLELNKGLDQRQDLKFIREEY